MTDNELQRAIAGELPELIDSITQLQPSGRYALVFFWLDGEAKDVRDTEWPYIVSQLEAKLTDFHAYMVALDEETGAGMHSDTFKQRYTLVTASWQQRAQAYFKVINKPIE